MDSKDKGISITGNKILTEEISSNTVSFTPSFETKSSQGNNIYKFNVKVLKANWKDKSKLYLGFQKESN